MKYGLTEGAEMKFFDVGEGVTVKPAGPFCKICRNKTNDDVGLPICETCIAEVIKITRNNTKAQ